MARANKLLNAKESQRKQRRRRLPYPPVILMKCAGNREWFLTRAIVPARAADAELLKKIGELHMVSCFGFRPYYSMLFLASPLIDL